MSYFISSCSSIICREMVRMTSEQEATDFGEVNLRQVTGFRRNTKLK